MNSFKEGTLEEEEIALVQIIQFFLILYISASNSRVLQQKSREKTLMERKLQRVKDLVRPFKGEKLDEYRSVEPNSDLSTFLDVFKLLMEMS